MKSRRVGLLLVSFVLACVMIGCGDKTEPDVEEPKTAGEKPKTVDSESDVTGPPKTALEKAVAAQKECSRRLGSPVEITNSIGMKLALIPPGEFVMGSPESDDTAVSIERPQHKVRITRPFYLGVYEVTQAEYEQLMGKNPSRFKGARNPVEQVSWGDATEFCEKLSAKEGKTYRLPTEAEWEFACRAGTTTQYSFGDDLPSLGEYAWYDDNSDRETHPVGEKKPNAWGLHDMHGNVWEWCTDCYERYYYTISRTDDPLWLLPTSSVRVVRGGSWNFYAGSCRSACRGLGPYGSHNHLGFRIAVGEQPEPEKPEEVVAALEAPQEAGIKKAVAAQKKCSQDLGSPVVITNSIGMKLTLIPPGEFMMGPSVSWGYGNDDDARKPRHMRIAKPFYLGVYEVTQAEYASVMGRNPSKFKSASNPVENMWDDAKEFCKRLSAKEGKTYRLPTEAEWEYACRAGTTTMFHFGDDESRMEEYAWCCGNTGDVGEGHPHRVGQKKPNPFGLYDMHGNVAERCDMDPVSRCPTRGGCFSDPYVALCSAGCTNVLSNPGFRVALGEKPEPDVMQEPKTAIQEVSVAQKECGQRLGVAIEEAIAAQEECSRKLGSPIEITNGIGMKFTLIPPGEFMMGAPESDLVADDNEKPRHRVRITKPFYLGVHEVTQAEYQEVMVTNPSGFEAAGNPVERVSWDDAMVFCKKLSAKEGKTYRLPTEAEWEYACRVGITGWQSFEHDLPTFSEFAWYVDNSDGKTHPVGEKRPNVWGLYDMHGNAQEWCADWWAEDYYAVSPTDDPPGPENGDERVLRGGDVTALVWLCRTSSRRPREPWREYESTGFRVAVVPPGADDADLSVIKDKGSVVTGEASPPARSLDLVGKKMRIGGSTIDGKPFDWEAYRGRIVLVNFWTSWCPYCWPAIANARRAYERYHDRGFDVVGINLDRNTDWMRAYLDKESIPWTVLHAKGAGWKHPVAVEYGIRSVPTMFLVDRDGRIVSVDARRNNLYGLLSDLGLSYDLTGPPVSRTQESDASPEAKPGPEPPFAIAPFNFEQAKAHQQAWANHFGADVQYVNSIGMKFALIPPGKFMMGPPKSDDKAASIERTPREVRLAEPFYLGLYEVTQEEYEKVMGENPSRFSQEGTDTSRNPVEQVSWDDAVEFCKRLSAKEGKIYRLPTVAEWEYAWRAGSTTRYSFGEDLESIGEYAWYHENSGGETHPVGIKKPNAWGLCDMHGNVHEWCADYYPVSPTEDPPYPERGYRTHCNWPGGDRARTEPADYDGWQGFRVALGEMSKEAKAAIDEAVAAQEAVVAALEAAQEAAQRIVAAQEECGERLGSPVRITNSIGMELVLIPAGEFMMGDETSQHKVRITKPFYLGVHEVTQAKYQEVMGENPSRFKGVGNPVERVSWDDATEFCKRLSAKEGKTYRLPTEAEWEYACRAGTTTQHSLAPYDFKKAPPSLQEYAWYYYIGPPSYATAKRTNPVGEKKPNAWGLYDMHGNVWEWCADWYDQDYYTVSPTDDPPGPETRSYRVTRGGSWYFSAAHCESSFRHWDVPTHRHDDLGFRVVAVPPVK